MKKQNTLRPSDIKYEPIPTKKQPLWMHSIDRPVKRGEAWKVFALFLIVCFALYVFLTKVYPAVMASGPAV